MVIVEQNGSDFVVRWNLEASAVNVTNIAIVWCASRSLLDGCEVFLSLFSFSVTYMLSCIVIDNYSFSLISEVTPEQKTRSILILGQPRLACTRVFQVSSCSQLLPLACSPFINLFHFLYMFMFIIVILFLFGLLPSLSSMLCGSQQKAKLYVDGHHTFC